MRDRVLDVDLEHLAALLERAFPGLGEVRPLSVLGRGFRSAALGTGGGYVVRVGVSPDAAGDYAREWRMGRFLASRLGPLVPEPLWYEEPGADFPYGALCYRKLAGKPPAWGVEPERAFARDLGAFMARLHGLSVDEALTAGVREVDPYARLLGARTVIMPVLASRLDGAAMARLVGWWEAFARDPRMKTTRRAVCHHDLWHDNLLASASGRLAGVLDLAHVEVGDPAHDFAAPRYFGAKFMAALNAAYKSNGGQLDTEEEYRAKRFYEAREFGGLAWAIEHDDLDEIEDSLGKILRGPIFEG